MEDLFVKLGALFLGALPSAILLAILVIYLKFVLFGPLEKVMAERFRKTEGKEQEAAEMVDRAESKAAEYAAAIHAAKTEIYAQQDALRKKLEAERDAAVSAAAERVKSELTESKKLLGQEVAAGRQRIDTEARNLAEIIVERVLERRGA